MRTLEFFRRFQQGRCYICAQTMLFKQCRGWLKNPLYATVDHVRPAADGHGKANNTLLACRRCNNRKGRRTPTACELLFLKFANRALQDEISGYTASLRRRRHQRRTA